MHGHPITWKKTLEHGKLDNNVYKVNKGDTVHFLLGSTLMGQKIQVFTNYPVGKHDGFVRETFHEIAWTAGSQMHNDDSSQFAEVKVQLAGTFKFYYTSETTSHDKPTGCGFFHVTPTLTVFKKNEELPLDAIQCLTFITKLLGPLSEWRDRVRVAAECEYNMVHLTPVQKLGHSNSAYSIGDYLSLDPIYGKNGKAPTYEQLGAELDYWRNEWGVLSVGDIVFNHISDDNPIIELHPDVGFNLINSPHLRPAFLLDRLLAEFGDQVAANKFADRGLPALINCQDHINALRHLLLHDVFPRGKFHEFFECDVEKISQAFRKEVEKHNGPTGDGHADGKELELIADGTKYERFGRQIDMQLAIKLFNKRIDDAPDEIVRVQWCIDGLKYTLEQLNKTGRELCAFHLLNATNALCGHVTYERVADDGPKVKVYNKTYPLVTCYFTYPFPRRSFAEEETLMNDDKMAVKCLAYNGWVMGDDPLSNFAMPPRMVYFRRELVCWGDCVKLRFGDKPADSPALWEHMTEYVKKCARVFHGFRLDNCHSTPLHVAEYLVDQARGVRPDLYVVAELFTGSEDLDNLFVNRLGITSLIREAQSAPDAHEQGRLVYKYGGVPVGAFMQRSVRPLTPQTAHALFMDMTHDNKCPITIRSVEDTVPTAALVSMACCATGSTRGYDELVPYHVNVVHEKRLYRSFTADSTGKTESHVSLNDAVLKAKAVVNQLHELMARQGFTQVYVDDRSKDVVCVTRHNPYNHHSVIAVARTHFNKHSDKTRYYLAPLQIDGVVQNVGYICHPQYTDKKLESDKFIVGLANFTVKTECGHEPAALRAQFAGVDILEVISDGVKSTVEFNDFPAGAAVAFHVMVPNETTSLINELRLSLCAIDFKLSRLNGNPFARDEIVAKLRPLCEELSLCDLNVLLFRCHEEEADDGWGGGAYDLPQWGKLPYCGLQGLVPLLTKIRLSDDLGHPLCGNLRAGDWLADYIIHRLTKNESTIKLAAYFGELFAPYRRLPHYLKPAYFDAIVCSSYDIICDVLWAKMTPAVQKGSDFLKSLALATVAFTGHSRSGDLPKLAASLKGAPAVDRDGKPFCVSLSAGLPHFSTGIFRNWGRDTFIALPGCLLATGRFAEARNIILAFAGTLRHGLIPNLLGGGVGARYNCRDAVWFWLYSIKLYCQQAPDGYKILSDPVRRLYPMDDVQPYAVDKEEPLSHTMFEALNRHFQGIKYRERNAGHQIDEHMVDNGFNINVFVCRDTGFVFGGNENNCGTWMDKMGSSEKAGNKGKPATPRDGAAVELQGLCHAVVSWLHTLANQNKFSFTGVSAVDGSQSWTWNDWAAKIQSNFERCFYVSSKAANDANPEPKYINRVGIIKDTFKSSLPFTDYQLRPNFAIAVTVSPSLLSPEAAWSALTQAQQALQGPLGMRTLDPTDWAYCGDYHNEDDGHEMKTAKGWNYHQGPEWLWVTGYFLRALLCTAKRMKFDHGQKEKIVTTVKKSLACHYTELEKSAWRSLPELTNKDGSFCAGSCRAQAWSVGCILEVLFELDTFSE